MSKITRGVLAWAFLFGCGMVGAAIVMGWPDGNWTLGIAIVALLLLPPEYDPAVQWKEKHRARERARQRPAAPPPPQHINCRCVLSPRTGWTDHGGFSTRPVNPSPHALPGETEADTIARLLDEARRK